MSSGCLSVSGGKENIVAAKRAVKAIRDGVKILAMHPQVGRVVEDMDVGFRDWPVDFGDSGYVVRYRLGDEQVTILAIRHQKESGILSIWSAGQ